MQRSQFVLPNRLILHLALSPTDRPPASERDQPVRPELEEGLPSRVVGTYSLRLARRANGAQPE